MKIIFIAVLAVILVVAGLFLYVFLNMRQGAVDIVEKPVDLVLAETADPLDSIVVVQEEPTPEPTPMPIYEEEKREEGVVNILLVGTDARTTAETIAGRSDSMMLASYNKGTNRITMVSFLRDARVARIGKKGKFSFYNKLNGAFSGGYAGGGPGELINTINYNFGLDIQEYVCIGFEGFAVLIDKIGGIDVEMDQAEINFVNDRITGYFVNEPAVIRNSERITAAPGLVHLTGGQALAHARNRHTGVDGGTGSDLDRVSRQQEIIRIVCNKITTEMNEQSVIGLIAFACDYVTTNMSLDTMTQLATSILKNGVDFSGEHVPFEGTYHLWKDEKGAESSQLEFDFDETTARLHTLLYGDAASAPTETPAG